MKQPQALSKEFLLGALRREGGDFRDAVAKSELSALVPPCPEWTVQRLVNHMAGLYEWVCQIIELGGEKPARREAQQRGDDVLAWFDEALATALSTLDKTDPDAPAWNWSTQPDVAAFWPRRMAHETAVHRWDAQMVSGLASPIDHELAADGVSEVLDTFLPAGRAAVTHDAEGLVRLTATDLGQTWLVRLRESGPTLLDEDTIFDESPEPQTRVAGGASDLVLALWGRVPVSVLAVEGDPARFERLRTA